MKRERHGRAKILTPNEIQILFNEGLKTLRDRALFGFCLYTACRINEACTQLTQDAYNESGAVRAYMTIRKGNSKGKLASRTLTTSEDLRLLLGQYKAQSGDKYLFPGRWGKKHIHPDSASLILRTACRKIGLEGVSTHSFRRTALTQMSDANIPFRVIAEVSGHHNLTQLHAYLEVKPEQVKGAIASLASLSYIGKRANLGYENTLNISQQELADQLSIDRSATGKSIKKLISKGYLEIVDTVGRQNIYMFNPNVAFKSRAKNLKELKHAWDRQTIPNTQKCPVNVNSDLEPDLEDNPLLSLSEISY